MLGRCHSPHGRDDDQHHRGAGPSSAEAACASCPWRRLCQTLSLRSPSTAAAGHWAGNVKRTAVGFSRARLSTRARSLEVSALTDVIGPTATSPATPYPLCHPISSSDRPTPACWAPEPAAAQTGKCPRTAGDTTVHPHILPQVCIVTSPDGDALGHSHTHRPTAPCQCKASLPRPIPTEKATANRHCPRNHTEIRRGTSLPPRRPSEAERRGQSLFQGTGTPSPFATTLTYKERPSTLLSPRSSARGHQPVFDSPSSLRRLPPASSLPSQDTPPPFIIIALTSLITQDVHLVPVLLPRVWSLHRLPTRPFGRLSSGRRRLQRWRPNRGGLS